MFGKGFMWLASLPPRIAIWCVRQVIGTTMLSVKTFLALLGEEARRWTVVAVWGLLLFGLYYSAGAVSTGMRQVLAFGVLCWFWGAFRAGERTVGNRLQAVRARAFYRQLDKRTQEIGERVTEAVRNARQGEGGGPRGLLRRAQLRLGSLPETTLELEEVEGGEVQFEPVIPLLRRRRPRASRLSERT